MPPFSEQGNDVQVELREQTDIKPSRPTAMYDDVILSTRPAMLKGFSS